MIPAENICVALDTADLGRARELASALAREVGWLKVGLTLYGACGPEAVRALSGFGPKVFLDLKLHDIPVQVAGAVRAASDLGAGLLTVHASGGPAMMKAAADGRANGLKVVAVTVLTSISEAELDAVWPGSTPAGAVARLTSMAVDAGLDGVVMSPLEVSRMRSVVPPEFMFVVPGIRPAGKPGTTGDDQSRVGTPGEVYAAGASVLVVGRPITGAADPVAATRLVRGIA
ncbi:MAG TPA: orotidine-5'-phosphate decarboxylase [Myxococcota bacterium]|nr:orotidine-5'-phosphate decarboxylase [Myxococcota bacterium]HPV03205.1 orotidine-5'-phosphate decarboxylase [Myxococcota bacterium]